METNLAYLAGFFDGEGCITVRPGRRTFTLTVVQVDPRPLELFRQTFGGRVAERSKPTSPNHQQVYRWDIYAGSWLVLNALRPYLIVKAEAADRALAIKGPPLPPGDRVRTKS